MLYFPPIGSGGATNLTVDTTWYVNSSTGNDTAGTGAVGAPWATLARAWVERCTYGAVDACTLTIRLVGGGPYNMPAMGLSVCTNGGHIVFAGDVASKQFNASGTFGANAFATPETGFGDTMPSLTGIGATFSGKFVRVTSGLATGALLTAMSTSTTALFPHGWKPSSGLTTFDFTKIVAGNTFEYFYPATTLRMAGPGAGPSNWISGSVSGGRVTKPSHIFYNLYFATNASFPFLPITMINSDVGFVACIYDTNMILSGCRVACGDIEDATFLGVPGSCFTKHAGLVSGGSRYLALIDGTWLTGVHHFPTTATLYIGTLPAGSGDDAYESGPNNYYAPRSAYMGGLVTAKNARISFAYPQFAITHYSKSTWRLLQDAKLTVGIAYVRWYVTSGDALNLAAGSEMSIEVNSSYRIETSAAAGVALRVTGGATAVSKYFFEVYNTGGGTVWATDTLTGVAAAFAVTPSGQLDPVTGSKIIKV